MVTTRLKYGRGAMPSALQNSPAFFAASSCATIVGGGNTWPGRTYCTGLVFGTLM